MEHNATMIGQIPLVVIDILDLVNIVGRKGFVVMNHLELCKHVSSIVIGRIQFVAIDHLDLGKYVSSIVILVVMIDYLDSSLQYGCKISNKSTRKICV